jgi:hypothetical protein
MAADISASLKPAAATISSEMLKLVSAARQVEQHNERPIAQQRANGWMLEALIAVVLFLIGGFCGDGGKAANDRSS